MPLAHARTIEEVVEANFAAFQKILPSLLASKAGQYVLLRDEEVAGYFETAGQAYAKGLASYPDRLFSVQRVALRAANIGLVSGRSSLAAQPA